ncbi:cyclodeaminase/cyclohydrolase family protein [Clostridium sardiniense]|uniref:cyclodeaminase/cyclohydrolase family protein n=1 Tax=Clostridium sardiniense TaxID=29369 RepID=UPI00195B20D6|nr:cyclodeaminase/cyclohydrolase family protein [Clostridium sardiniense]MBM7835884.1 formiminotetrahydrofolate cyclodeaminase [Clostridium sardiniense]
MLFKDYKIEEFLNDLSSNSPSPGGGSTAALVAGLAGCLNNMVYSLTINKKAFNNLSEENKCKMISLEKECKNFITNCIEFMEEDRTCFNELMNCYKLPKDTEVEKIHRKEELKSKTYDAMLSPLKVCRECIKFYDNIEFATEYGNKMLISDAGVAASLLHAAVESSIINVKVNLNSLRDEEFFNEVETEMNSLLNESKTKKEDILNIVNEYIYK